MFVEEDILFTFLDPLGGFPLLDPHLGGFPFGGFPLRIQSAARKASETPLAPSGGPLKAPPPRPPKTPWDRDP